jgi:hypothetical protein
MGTTFYPDNESSIHNLALFLRIMRPRWVALVLILVSVTSSSLPPLNGVDLDRRSPGGSSLFTRDDHHKVTPLLEIDESQVLPNHEPTPPSYYTADWEDEGHQSRHGGLMIVHGVFMGFAFFVSWPLGAFNIRSPFILT